jgi:hypothetical protein
LVFVYNQTALLAKRMSLIVQAYKMEPPFSIVIVRDNLMGPTNYASLRSMQGGFDPWCGFEVCKTRCKPKLSFLVRRHMTYTVCVHACVCVCVFVSIQTNMLKIIQSLIVCRSFCKRNQNINMCCLKQIRRFTYHLILKCI